MGLLEKIKYSLELNGEVFEYGTDRELNNLLKSTPMPAVFMNLITDSEQITVSGQTVEQANVMVFFINLTKWDLLAPENELIIEECKKRADKWLHYVKDSSILKKINNARYKRIYLQYDEQFTGIGVNIILRETVGDSNCIDPPQPVNPAEWQPQPDWFDIVKIFEKDKSPDKRQILLMSDTDLVTTINTSIGNSTARYVTSDGKTYSGGTTFTHTWDLSQDKHCHLGYKTRYIMVYSSNVNINCNYTNFNALFTYIGNGSNVLSLLQYVAATGTSSEVLQAIKYENNVTFNNNAMNNEAFRIAYSLQYFNIPKEINILGTNCFYQANSYGAKNNKLNINENITSLNVNSLNGCNGISDVIISGGPALLATAINITALNSLTFKKSIPSAVDSSIAVSRALLSVNIPTGWKYPANLNLTNARRLSYSSVINFLNNLGFNEGNTITITLFSNVKNRLLSTPEGVAAIAHATSQNITIA